jgi:hypothetical protein
MSFKSNVYRSLHGTYDNILNYLNVVPLITRRLQLLSKFLHKLIFGLIDCPGLLYLINFKINFFNTRNPELFLSCLFRQKLYGNCAANLLTIAGNSYTFVFN